MTRRTYRVNADSWTVLRDILVDPAESFNGDMARRYVGPDRSYDGYSYSNVLRGRRIEEANDFTTGQLPDPYSHEMKDSVVTYVIYSYETPIAYRRVRDWNGNGTANYEWIVPDVTYSRTTSKHQGKVRTALSQISGGI